jgi:putative oxidoreductase
MTEKNLTGKIWYGSNESLLSLGLLFLRCLIGILLFIAGAGKLFGLFGGYGMEATIEGFSKIGIPVVLTYMSTYTELLGGILLTIGLLTRPVAFAVMINMLVATIVTLPSGFMGPTGAQTPFMFLVIDIVILLAGPMKFSVDRLLVRKIKTDASA